LSSYDKLWYYTTYPKYPKLIIDIHHPYISKEGLMKDLLYNMYIAKVDKVCLFTPSYRDFKKKPDHFRDILKSEGDRILLFGSIFPGRDPESAIDEYYSYGVSGLKFLNPTDRYDADNFLKYYEKAEEYSLPIVFHTGVMGGYLEMDVSSENMRPSHLDRIARLFPKLHLVCAHMGDPWYLEAYMTSQKHRNFWLDISGKAILLKAIALKKYLWVRTRPEKLVFGLDEYPTEYLRLIHTWNSLLYEMGISQEDREKIFGLNAKEILQL